MPWGQRAWPRSHAERWLARGLARPLPLPGPHAVLTPGRTEVGEGTKLEEDNGIRGIVLCMRGWGSWTEPYIPFTCPSLPPCACPGTEMGTGFLVEGMGKTSAGQASTGTSGLGVAAEPKQQLG